jgi:hypothetical protein
VVVVVAHQHIGRQDAQHLRWLRWERHRLAAPRQRVRHHGVVLLLQVVGHLVGSSHMAGIVAERQLVEARVAGRGLVLMAAVLVVIAALFHVQRKELLQLMNLVVRYGAQALHLLQHLLVAENSEIKRD